MKYLLSFVCVAALAQPVQPGGGGSGASRVSQLTDLKVTITSSRVLTIGLTCSSASPCNPAIGDLPTQVSNSATLTTSGTPTGTAYLWVTAAGARLVGLPGGFTTGTCNANCTTTTATAFPEHVIYLATCSAISGIWQACTDQRAMLRIDKDLIIAGTGAPVLSETPTARTLTFAGGGAATSVTPVYAVDAAFSITSFGTATGTATACASIKCSCTFQATSDATPIDSNGKWQFTYSNATLNSGTQTTGVITPGIGNPSGFQAFTYLFNSTSTAPSWSLLSTASTTANYIVDIACIQVN